VGLIFFGVVALVICAVVIAAVLKAQRHKTIMSIADANGLQYSVYDIFSIITTNDFHLFQMGDGRGCGNVMRGSWKGVDLYEADYWYYTEQTNGRGQHTRTYTRFQVAIVPISAYLPQLSVTAETLLTRAAGHLGMHDINFESDEFNRTFKIKAQDRAFAFKFIDARMMQWMLFLGPGFSFETSGDALLVYTKRTKPSEIVKLLEAARQSLDRIPRLIWEDYAIGRTTDFPA
jgi:hypothetical protein